MSRKNKSQEAQSTPAAKIDAQPASAGRRFVFEFFELKDGKTIKTVEISVMAKNEREAWNKLQEKLENNKRQLEYSGRFFIQDA